MRLKSIIVGAALMTLGGGIGVSLAEAATPSVHSVPAISLAPGLSGPHGGGAFTADFRPLQTFSGTLVQEAKFRRRGFRRGFRGGFSSRKKFGVSKGFRRDFHGGTSFRKGFKFRKGFRSNRGFRRGFRGGFRGRGFGRHRSGSP